MTTAKIAKISSEFTPERILFILELIPNDGMTFSPEASEAVGKLQQVAKYAAATFGEAVVLQETIRRKVEKEAGDGAAGPNGVAVIDRTVAVFEAELKRAEKSGNSAMIREASKRLDEVKARVMAK